MNFVIFSYHFLPLADAESFCTTRFASSLANAGHNVKVVTMDWPASVDAKVYDFLVDKRIEIVRVPLKKLNGAPVWTRMRYLTHEWNAVNIGSCIAALKDVLKHTNDPVLISRAFPVASLIVAWHCRAYAKKWIAHLSDPMPWFVSTRAKSFLETIWARRAIRDASAISLTCNRAKRFFSDRYGHLFDKTNVVVVRHIGDPSLTDLVHNVDDANKANQVKSIVHSGLLYPGRGARQIISAVKILNENGLSCRFIQVGEIDAPIKAEVEGSQFVDVVNDKDPTVSAMAQQNADVIFVPDLVISHLPYSPFCASKFAYQVFGDKPIVAFSRQDSLMGECAQRFPDAGLFFADVDRSDSLQEAVGAAVRSVGRHFDRSGLRKLFSRDSIAAEFSNFVEGL